jgi:hypothetical protein
MKDKIVFIYNPWKYLNSYKNTLDNVRKYYPNSDIFIFFDEFRDDLQEYLEVAANYNCIVSVRNNELGYIHRSDNLETNLPKQLEWIDRVKSSCETSESEWVMLLEDDVLIKREIREWPSEDVGTCREYFRPGGGAIFRREVFLDSIKKADISYLIRVIPNTSWAGDLLLEYIFRNNNIKHEKWIELAEPGYCDNTDHAVYHGYKDLHKLG